MFRKFTILLSLILASTTTIAFTPVQAEGMEVLGIQVLWWFWLCFVSILIVGFFVWLMLVAGRRNVEAPPPPEPPMAGRTQKADLSAGASESTSKRIVDTTEATMAETKYVVTDPDAKYVKGSLSGNVDSAASEDGQTESEVVAETEAMVEEVAAEVEAEASADAATVVEEPAAVVEEVQETVTETVVEETVVEEVAATAEVEEPAAVVPAAIVEEKPAKKKAPAKKKGRKSSKYGNGRDDLKKVEGIGPKIEGLLNADGIMTFEQLANAKIDRIQTILDAAGPRYRTHKPDTWPEQSALCAKGDWDALEKLQDILDGGRRK